MKWTEIYPVESIFPPFEQLGPVDVGPVYMEAGPPDR